MRHAGTTAAKFQGSSRCQLTQNDGSHGGHKPLDLAQKLPLNCGGTRAPGRIRTCGVFG